MFAARYFVLYTASQIYREAIFFELREKQLILPIKKIMKEDLWAWGANSCGQLGLGCKNEQEERPKKVDTGFLAGKPISQISGGGSHTLLLAGDGSVFVSGSDAKGQTGAGGGETFTKLDLDLGSPVTAVECGWDFSYLVLRNGSVYASGSNFFGQLGLGEDVKQTSKFTKVEGLDGEKIVGVACGMRHALLLSDSGTVFVTGDGKKGQLGLGPEAKRIFEVRRCPVPPAVSLSSGQNFSVVRCPGSLLGFGDNKFAQLRNVEDPNFYDPVRIGDELNVACGWTHVIKWTEDGVKSRGRNTYGQLGRKSGQDDESVEFPKDAKVVEISSGYEHVLCKTDNGEIYVWGWNEHGNCGLNGVENVSIPMLLDLGAPVKKCFAGSGHSFCVS